MVGKRFSSEYYRSPGPKYDSVGSMGKQVLSLRDSAGGCKFGTSSREGVKKMYGLNS